MPDPSVIAMLAELIYQYNTFAEMKADDSIKRAFSDGMGSVWALAFVIRYEKEARYDDVTKEEIDALKLSNEYFDNQDNHKSA